MPNLFDPLADPAATVARHPHLRHAPASTRNRESIRQALAQLLPATNSATPKAASSAATCRDSVGCVRPSCRAAADSERAVSVE